MVGEEEHHEEAVMMRMRRAARCSTWPVARGGWAGNVTGGLRRTFPYAETFSKFRQRGLEDRWRPSLCSFWSRILSDGRARCRYCIDYSQERRVATAWIYN